MNARVLILDGDRWQREALAAALAYEGFHAEHTGEAACALALLTGHRFQLVLLDPSAPETGGWETIERLVLLHPKLPVIVLAPGEEQPGSPWLAGVSDLVGKPIDFSALLRAIERALALPAKTFLVCRTGRELTRCLPPNLSNL